MILAGQCGAFNPLMLECLLDISSSLKKKKWAINPRKGMNRQTFLILLADFTILRWIPQRKLCSSWNLRECAIISWRRAAEILFLLIPFHRRYSPLTRLAVNEAGLQNLHFPIAERSAERSCGGAIPETAYPGRLPRPPGKHRT